MTHIIYFASDYLPRRGRTQEGDALVAYFAMNIASVLGDIHLSGKKVYTLFIAPVGGDAEGRGGCSGGILRHEHRQRAR